MQLFCARHPDALQSRRPILVEEFLELARRGRVEALATMIEMLDDLQATGLDCRFLKKLAHTPLWELKSTTRGGEKGGARIYLFIAGNPGAAGLVNCEVKAPDAPADMQKLKVALQVLKAFKDGVDVFKEPNRVEEAD